MSFNIRPRSPRSCRTRSPKGVICLSRTPPAAKPDIECTGSAMLGRGFLEADHQGAEIGQAKPMGNHAPENPAFLEHAAADGRAALAGDDQNEPVAGALRPMKEMQESEMGLLLTHPVQVDDAVHILAAAPEGLER